MKQIAYDDLPFLVKFMAFNVSERAGLTHRESVEFAEAVDAKCRAAYASKEDNFFKKCVRKTLKGSNTGRDELLEVWIPHWLTAYQFHPPLFIKRATQG